MIKLDEVTTGNICQVNIEGRLDANTCTEVEKYLQEKVDSGLTRFVLNLEKVPFIASAGLRVVLVYAKKLRQNDSGDLKLALLQDNVKKVFEISGLNNFLSLFDDMESALDSFEEKNHTDNKQ